MKSAFHYLALEFVGVTEQAAIASARWIGRGEKDAADQAAVDAMRGTFNEINFQGEVVIGEGEKDEAPELYVGEKLGNGNGPLLDIAVDPLECTSSVAYGRPNAMSVIAFGPKGTLYKAIDSYMEKIAVGPEAKNVIDLDAPPKKNIENVAKALGKDVREMTVAILDRERHKDLMEEIRKAGARVQTFTDGDIAFGIAPCLVQSPVDMLMGIGGSTEAVLCAAALKCMGGEILARWKPKDEKHRERLARAGFTDFKTVFTTDDLARGSDVAFTATGVIGGPLLDGAMFAKDHIITHSVVMSTNPRTIRFIKTKRIS
jgi:fructose-1,6-bisphosphatase II